MIKTPAMLGILCLYRFFQNTLGSDIMRQNLQLSDLNDIKFHSVLLGEGIHGFVYVSKRNVSHIFIEESLSPESTAETLAHETYHLKHDKLSHGIGLDKQHSESEQKADKFAMLNARLMLSLMGPTAI